MEINTEKNIGDLVYYLIRDTIHHGRIKAITITINKVDSPIKNEVILNKFEKYSVGPMANTVWSYEAFNTLEELIDKLQKVITED